jgi:hypothetical protein
VSALDELINPADLGKISLPAGTADAVMRYMYPKPSVYTSEPATWIRERCNAHVWSKQEEVCQSVVDHKYTAVKACHGPGKSFIAGKLACWWLDPSVHPLGSAFVITTAPSWPQVQTILWREIRRTHRQSDLFGRITLECMWHMGDGRSSEEIVAMGRKPQDYDEQAFQGIHAEYVLVLMDEACGIPKALWDAVKSIVTNDQCRVLAIGNPDDPGSEFAMNCRPGTDWNTIRISAYDSPAFTGEYCPPNVLKQLVSREWVEERRRDWGEGSNLWISKVEGEFPDVSDDYLITPSMIAKAHAIDLTGFAMGRYGMDVARMGEDKTVIYRNRGGQIRKVDSWAKQDTMQSADRAYQYLSRHLPRAVPMNVDGIGLGAGVYDRLRQRGCDVGNFGGAERALNPAKFNNRRSEMWWTFRRLMEEGLIDLDPEDNVLAEELQTIKWSVDLSGRICIESKEDAKKRGVQSPNHGDAAAMSTVEAGTILRMNTESVAGSLLTKAM